LFQVIERIDDTLALLNLVRTHKKVVLVAGCILILKEFNDFSTSDFYSISGMYDAYNLSTIHSESYHSCLKDLWFESTI